MLRHCKVCLVEKKLEEDFHLVGKYRDWTCKPCRHRKQMESRRPKFAAQRAVQNAVKAGRLTRPSVCETCGVESQRIEGHHADYEKKLEVMWLCRSCHMKHHSTGGVATATSR